MKKNLNIRRTALLPAGLILCVFLAGCTKHSESVPETAETQTEEAVTKEETTPETAPSETSSGTGETFESTIDSAHALSLSGGTASYDGILVTKTGDSEGDEADFYGTNAAVFAENGASLTVTDARISTDGSHANAVFSYGEGTNITIRDSVIETEEKNSGGIMVTGGGSITAENLTVTTKGGSSAPIRSDRGGGTELVTGGTFTSYGSGSPAIYSTADVTVTDAVLYADGSQAVVVEGKNSVTLKHTDATGNHTKKNSSHSSYNQAVLVYQSMSGDASEGCGTFTMEGGSLTSLYGGMFFVTNTVAEISLSGVRLTTASDDFLRIGAAGWGKEGSNGGQVTFTAGQQEMEGVISVDDISTLNLLLLDGSSFTGCIEGEGKVHVELSGGSFWSLTKDCAVTSLTCDEDSIRLNGHTLTVGGTAYAAGASMSGEKIEITAAEKNDTGSEKKQKETGEHKSKPDDDGKHSGKKQKKEGDTPPAKPGE